MPSRQNKQKLLRTNMAWILYGVRYYYTQRKFGQKISVQDESPCNTTEQKYFFRHSKTSL